MKGRKSLRWLTAPQEPHLSCLRNTNHLSFFFSSFFFFPFFWCCLSLSMSLLIEPRILNEHARSQSGSGTCPHGALPSRCQVVASPYLR
ncbi:hypothetical protein M440DRAFT_193185 [Trichoderma longibrachiatum ATCC 18648]|uniref:Uncharacterized protein n=1 Tax=Trichoderma longibrachiatum ATCC 18648 TaxID=983965 RepID=A0A2T4CFP7_TRILO|nr:hypothetical protein M440DRAFT_193185 [Trichoderma longibrachiatum ATCC 18648]